MALLFHCLIANAQTLPTWTYTTSDVNLLYSSDFNPQNGHYMMQYGRSGNVNCQDYAVYSLLLDSTGTAIYENTTDTSSNCIGEWPNMCRIITSPNSEVFVNSYSKNTNYDSAITTHYNQSGQVIWSGYTSFSPYVVTNLNDGYCYSFSQDHAVAKTDTFFNQIWSVPIPNQNCNLSNLTSSISGHFILLGMNEFVTNNEVITRFIAVDSSGAYRFNVSYNVDVNQYEYLEKTWYTSTHQLIATSFDSNPLKKLFCLDTMGVLQWQITLPYFSANNEMAYDSVHQVIYSLNTVASDTSILYKISCTSGSIIDSLVLPHISVGKIITDRNGHIIIASYYSADPNNVHRVQRLTYNYFLDWTGVIPRVPPNQYGGIYDVRVSTDGAIWISYDFNQNVRISKFDTPDPSSTTDLANDTYFIQALPNPASNGVCIQRNDAIKKSSTVVIRSVSGQLVQEIAVAANQSSVKIDTENLASGIYFIQWSDAQPIKLVVAH